MSSFCCVSKDLFISQGALYSNNECTAVYTLYTVLSNPHLRISSCDEIASFFISNAPTLRDTRACSLNNWWRYFCIIFLMFADFSVLFFVSLPFSRRFFNSNYFFVADVEQKWTTYRFSTVYSNRDTIGELHLPIIWVSFIWVIFNCSAWEFQRVVIFISLSIYLITRTNRWPMEN